MVFTSPWGASAHNHCSGVTEAPKMGECQNIWCLMDGFTRERGQHNTNGDPESIFSFYSAQVFSFGDEAIGSGRTHPLHAEDIKVQSLVSADRSKVRLLPEILENCC